MKTLPHVVVVGGGISGLAAAWYLTQGPNGPRATVTLLESSERFGGKLALQSFGGLSLDTGAEALLAARPEAVGLCKELGLETVPAATTQASIYSRGRLRAIPRGLLTGVPTDLRKLAASGILSLPGLLRIPLDHVLPRTVLHGDVSVGDYVSTRLGGEVTQRLVEPMLGGVYAGRAETQDRFYELLDELRRDREERAREWGEYKDEQNHKWDEQNRKWDEQNRKWDENQAELKRLHEEIMAQAKKFDRSIGALGARWGTQSEKAFRDALAGILEQSFGVQVVNVNDYDDEGTVFGRPDQVELDVIIKNGLLLICELKSSIDKAGMYIFERKARFYEKRHQRTANRLIAISPMIDARARKVAERLGIETYGDSTEVEAL